ncbi:MAG: hypothetical protein M3Z04_15715 [Chloroflexota bacterium]|nr:hypothetical protein [Chloroflexota bacterium]
MINFLGKTGNTYGVIDLQFRAGDEPGEPGKHKGFEITYLETTTPVPSVTVFPRYTSYSDFGPAPIPTWAKIQSGATHTPTVGPGTPTVTPTPTFNTRTPLPFTGSDRHVIVVDQRTCNLYEMYNSYPRQGGNWDAGSTAQWSLNSNTVRPTLGPTGRPSADASGLPMYPLIPRYAEVASGSINHAIRVTVASEKVRCTNNSLGFRGAGQSPCPGNGFSAGYIWPATYSDGIAPATTPAALPMGTHLRLRNNFTLECNNCPQTQIFIIALKNYGAIIADTDNTPGYPHMGLHAEWTVDPTPGTGWNNDDLYENLTRVHLYDFEVVDATSDCTASYTWCPLCEIPCGGP